MSRRATRDNRILAAILAVVMAASLMAPVVLAAGLGDASDEVYICGLEEHEHGPECYSGSVEWGCRDDVGDDVLHEHSEICYDEDGFLRCYLAERAAHVHDDSCYEDVQDSDVSQNPGSGDEDSVGTDGSDGETGAVTPGETVETPDDVSGDSSEVGSSSETRDEIIPGEPEGEPEVLDGDETVFDDEAPLERVLICEIEETAGLETHVHDESCLVGERVLTCELPVHVHDDACVVKMMSEEDVMAFVDAVNRFCDEVESGEYEGSEAEFFGEIKRFDEILAGFEYMSEDQATRVSAVMARLEPYRDFDFDTNELNNQFYALFSPLIKSRLVAGQDDGVKHEFVLRMKDGSRLHDSNGGAVYELRTLVPASGDAWFEPSVVFNQEGTYELSLRDESQGWWCADEWTVKVTVVRGSDGNLSASGVYILDGTDVSRTDCVDLRVVPQTTFGWSAKTMRQADLIMSKLSTEERVGQLFLVHYPGDGAGTVAQAREWIEKYHLGGYLVFAAMFQNSTPDAVRQKIADTQAASRVPMLFSVDEEGGKVTRVSQWPQFRSSKFLGPRELMSAGGTSRVASDAREKSAFLADLGLNVNHAPDCDVASGPSAYIYERTFGGDGLYNAGGAAAVVGAMEGTGVGSTMKHFPGYGGTGSNTHDGFAVNELSVASFEYDDILPFLAGMYAGGRAVMVTHNTCTAFDSENPVSLSPTLYRMLRTTWNFDGVAMTDDLNMKAITNIYGEGNQGLAALEAGADIAMVADADACVPPVLEAVASGRLPMSRVNESCRRVLCWKIELGILDPAEFLGPDEPDVPSDGEATFVGPDGTSFVGDFEAAWAMANQNSGKVYLNKDCEFESAATVNAGSEIALDLGGHSLKYSGGGSAFVVDGRLEILDGVGSVASSLGDVASRPSTGYDPESRTLTYGYLKHNADGHGTYVRGTADFSGLGSVEASGVYDLVRISDGGELVLEGGYLTNAGGATCVNVESGGTLTMRGGAVAASGNAASRGGGVLVSGSASILGGYVAGNEAAQGGGVYVSAGGVLTVRDAVVACNAATEGGGLFTFMSGEIDVDDAVVANNVAARLGGGILVDGIAASKSAVIHGEGCFVSMNEASSGGGLAIRNSRGGVVRLQGYADVGGNVASEDGGGVYNDAAAELSAVMIHENEATRGGGWFGTLGNLRIQSSTLRVERNRASGDGGGFYFANGLLNDITGCVVAGNEARRGGGFCVMPSPARHPVTFMPGAEIYDNSAREAGGGIYAECWKLTLDGIHVQNNAAPLGGGVYCAGRPYDDGGRVIVSDGTWILNNVRAFEDDELPLDSGAALTTWCDDCAECACGHCWAAAENPDAGEEEEGGVEAGPDVDVPVTGGESESGGDEDVPVESVPGEDVEEGDIDIGDSDDVGSAPCSCHDGVKCCDECACAGLVQAPVIPETPFNPEDVFYNYGDEIPSSSNASNLYLSEGVVVSVRGTWYDGTRVGVSVERYPDPRTGLIRIGTAEGTDKSVISSYGNMFIPDNENYACMFYLDFMCLGSRTFSGGDVSGGVADVLFQYYGDVWCPDTEGDPDDVNNLRRLFVFSTDGGRMPSNSDTNDSAPQRYMYVGSDDKIKMHSVLTPIYSEIRCNPDTGYETVPSLAQMNRVSERDAGYYEVAELWVAEGFGLSQSNSPAGFRVYEYSDDLYLTTNEEDSSSNAVYLPEKAVVRFVCRDVSGFFDAKANFYDYDVSDGVFWSSAEDGVSYPTSAQATREASGQTSWLRVAQAGINSLVNYSASWKRGRLVFGNKNIYPDGFSNTINGAYVNQNNLSIFGGCIYGLVTGLDGDGNLVYANDVSAPKLFNEGDATGKTVIPGHSLRFDRTGDTYTLKAVTGTSLNELDRLYGRDNWNHTKKIWSNYFWPMDAAPTWGSDGHDIKFGSTASLALRRFVGVSQTGTLTEADDGVDHNPYFGMTFELTFRLDADYVAPLAYYFFGDDDMWVFLDGKLVCDIGGVHSSVGQYVNLRDYLPVGSSGTHTLSFFYTERGAGGSTCWMQFQLPHPLVVTTDPPPSEGLEFGAVSIQKRVAGLAETDERFAMRVDILDSNGVALPREFDVIPGDGFDASLAPGTISSGDVVSLGMDDVLTVVGLPVGTRVVVTELLTEEQAGAWTADASAHEVVVETAESDVTVLNTYYVAPAGGPMLPATGGPGVLVWYFVVGWSVAAAAGAGLIRLRVRARSREN